MKIILLTFAIIAVATAAPIEEGAMTTASGVEIVRSSQTFEVDGSYKFSFETADGYIHEETGSIVNPGKEDAYVARVGLYKYKDPSGEVVEIRYTADTKGFVPTGAHIPTVPVVPQVPDVVVPPVPDVVVPPVPDVVVPPLPDLVVLPLPDVVVPPLPDLVVPPLPEVVVPPVSDIVSSMPDVVVSSMPDVVVSSMPDVVVSSMPDVVVSSMPDVVVSSMPDDVPTDLDLIA